MTKGLLAACCLFFLAINTAWGQEPFTEKVVCFGDSITMGYRAGAGNRFTNVLQKRAPEAEFITKGSGGRTTNSGKANLAKFLEDGSDATTFIIQLGVNDLKRKTEFPPNTIKNMEEIIATIREKAPDARIIICGPPRIVPEQLDEGIVEREVFNEETNRLLKEMGKSFKQLAEGENVQFVDLYEVVSSENYPDGLHPDAAGHQQIAEALWKALTGPTDPEDEPDTPQNTTEGDTPANAADDVTKDAPGNATDDVAGDATEFTTDDINGYAPDKD